MGTIEATSRIWLHRRNMNAVWDMPRTSRAVTAASRAAAQGTKPKKKRAVMAERPAIAEALRRAALARKAAEEAAWSGTARANVEEAEARPAADRGHPRGPTGETEDRDEATVVVEVDRPGAANGSGQRHFAISLTPIRERDGRRVGSVIILSDVTRRVELYHEVRLAVSSRRHNHSRGAARLTVSVGVSGVDVLEGETFGLLIEAADGALYEAKSAGKDCVIEASLPVAAQSDA